MGQTDKHYEAFGVIQWEVIAPPMREPLKN